MDQVSIQRRRRGGDYFFFFAVAAVPLLVFCFYPLLSTYLRGARLCEVPGEGGRPRRWYLLDWHIKAEARRAGRRVLCGGENWCWSQSTEPSRNFSKLLLETVGGTGRGVWISVPLFSPFPLSLVGGKSSLVAQRASKERARFDAKALNVFMESTLAIIPTMNLHYPSAIEAFLNQYLRPDEDKRWLVSNLGVTQSDGALCSRR